MCGIAGYWRFDRPHGDERLLSAMIARLAHRGPDGQGLFLSNRGPNLAHARLSIQDPGPAARQPLHRGGVTLVCNGEIYNAPALRRALEQAGHVFQSRSDNEVILEGYRRWGDDLLDKVRGMFAFALWDRENRRLILARDPMGEKPLIWHHSALGFAFASEAKALFALDWVPRRPDPQALYDYLGCQHPAGTATGFDGIQRLAPGHRLVIEAGKTPRPQPYWQLRSAPQSQTGDESAQLRRHLERSIAGQLASDVKIGCFLSGGADSGTVTALATRLAGPLDSFTLGFQESDLDERPAAARLARHCGTRHHEAVITPQSALESLSALSWHLDMPFADPSALACHHLAQLARGHVGVALTGDGGDETLLGYDRYGQPDLFRPQSALAPILGWLARSLPPAPSPLSPLAGLRRRLTHCSQPPAARYAQSLHFFHQPDLAEALGPRLRPCLERPVWRLIAKWLAAQPADARAPAWADLHLYLPDDLLVKTDMTAMAVGLETRAPFLDRDLQDWAAALPLAVKRPNGIPKGLLRRMAEPLLPPGHLDAPKRGFGLPMERWLNGPWRRLARDLLLPGQVLEQGLIRRPWLEALIAAQERGRPGLWAHIWGLIQLEIWLRTWIQGDGSRQLCL